MLPVVARITSGGTKNVFSAGCSTVLNGPAVNVAELSEPTVAVEAEDAAHKTRLVIVVDVVRRSALADRAPVPLRLDQRVDLVGADAVAMLQVVVPRAAMKALAALARTRVVAVLAVAVPTILRVPITRELVVWFPLLAVRTSLDAVSVSVGCDRTAPDQRFLEITHPPFARTISRTPRHFPRGCLRSRQEACRGLP